MKRKIREGEVPIYRLNHEFSPALNRFLTSVRKELGDTYKNNLQVLKAFSGLSTPIIHYFQHSTPKKFVQLIRTLNK